MNDLLRSALIVSVLAFGPVIGTSSAYAQETEQPQTESEEPAPAPAPEGSDG
ncbi:MAG: hypothetical protein ACI9MU_004022 [Alphaproteobacteria bacterium]|jgi:hypothetical protein